MTPTPSRHITPTKTVGLCLFAPIVALCITASLQLGCTPDATKGGSHEEGHHGEGTHQQAGHDKHGADKGHSEHGKSNVITLSKGAVENAGFSYATVKKRVIDAASNVPATITWTPDRVAQISSVASGIIDEIYVTPGDSVEKGDKLLTIRSANVGRARASLQRARAHMSIARKNYNRQKNLHDAQISSERAMLEAQLDLEKARAELHAARTELSVYGTSSGTGSSLILKAPIAGTVVSRNVHLGQSIKPSERLLKIVNTEEVWIMGQVYGADSRSLSVGTRGVFSLSGYDKRWEGTIDYIAPVADMKSRAVTIRMSLGNADGQLRPGQYGTLSFDETTGKQKALVAAPKSALQRAHNTWYAFTKGNTEGEFVAHPVTIGTTSNGYIQILEGLKPNTQVVTDGSFILKSELIRDQLGSGHAH